jgi:hypothetical protein
VRRIVAKRARVPIGSVMLCSADLEQTVAATPATNYRLASMTKDLIRETRLISRRP